MGRKRPRGHDGNDDLGDPFSSKRQRRFDPVDPSIAAEVETGRGQAGRVSSFEGQIAPTPEAGFAFDFEAGAGGADFDEVELGRRASTPRGSPTSEQASRRDTTMPWNMSDIDFVTEGRIGTRRTSSLTNRSSHLSFRSESPVRYTP